MYDKILFIDFDGTITEEETMSGMMKRWTPKWYYTWQGLRFLLGRIPLATLVQSCFSKIPSSRYPELLDYVLSVPIRPGFEELLDICRDKNIPVVLLSGGVRPCIRKKLEAYEDRFLATYDVDLDLSGPTMRLHSDREGDGYLLRKETVMAEYDCNFKICIGDSYSDFQMGRAANLVFARDDLAKELQKNEIPYVPWEDFHDVCKVLRDL